MKKVSTTALSKYLNIPSQELFSKLVKLDLIRKENDVWELTEAGLKKGGSYKESKQYGRYIVWPENLDLDSSKQSSSNNSQESDQSITATVIARKFDLTAKRINSILSELGWVDKGLKGWLLTEQGEKQGGLQAEDVKSGIPYVRWSKDILDSNSLIETVEQVKGTNVEAPQNVITHQADSGFQQKLPARDHCADGHFVRSKAEMVIDNWLYMAEIVHAYERKLPIDEEVYSDFYIPTGKVYIEYWGFENDARYLAQKVEKIAVYKKYGLNLIELKEDDINNLDNILPRLLLKYGVEAY